MSDQQKKDLRKQISNNLSRGTLTPDNSAVLILSHIADALEDLATMAKYLTEEINIKEDRTIISPGTVLRLDVLRHPDFDGIKEEEVTGPDGTPTGYRCTLKHKKLGTRTVIFTLVEANSVKIMEKDVYQKYPMVICMHKAFELCAASLFPDVVKHLDFQEVIFAPEPTVAQENAVQDETPSLTPELIEKYKICRPVDTLVGEKYKIEEPSETSEVFNLEPVAMPVFHAGTGKKFGEKSKS